MEKRAKILVVEDVDLFRGLLIEVLEHEQYFVEGASNLKQALAILDQQSFDIAVVDIMLNGPSDSSNRDGLLVFRRLQELGEGTKVFALTGQRSGPDLARDILKEFGADDYFSKDRWSTEGSAYVLKKIRESLRAAPPSPHRQNWGYTLGAILHEVSEPEFVHDIAHNVQACAFDALRSTLIEAVRWLHPVLKANEPVKTISGTQTPGVFDTTFWSKGQGCAVQLLLYGKARSQSEIEAAFGVRDGEVLLRGGKGGLKSLVVARRELSRTDFAARRAA